jgi:hypothetical protein
MRKMELIQQSRLPGIDITGQDVHEAFNEALYPLDIQEKYREVGIPLEIKDYAKLTESSRNRYERMAEILSRKMAESAVPVAGRNQRERKG